MCRTGGGRATEISLACPSRGADGTRVPTRRLSHKERPPCVCGPEPRQRTRGRRCLSRLAAALKVGWHPCVRNLQGPRRASHRGVTSFCLWGALGTRTLLGTRRRQPSHPRRRVASGPRVGARGPVPLSRPSASSPRAESSPSFKSAAALAPPARDPRAGPSEEGPGALTGARRSSSNDLRISGRSRSLVLATQRAESILPPHRDRPTSTLGSLADWKEEEKDWEKRRTRGLLPRSPTSSRGLGKRIFRPLPRRRGRRRPREPRVAAAHSTRNER